MKRKIWILAVFTAVVVSCGIEDLDVRPDTDREDIWFGPGVNAGDSGREVCYVTAFDYPEDYDWRTDKEKGSVKCSLVVFADGVPMMKVPVGDRYEVSSDPDMHRMLGGHIYTDYSTDSETVIKRDGKTLIRYPGREMICGMLADEENVYTLGHPRQGEGFTYRKNGEILLERSSGRSFGRLHYDRDSICFAFAEPVLSQGDTVERYYHCTNGRVSQAALREDIRKVWDIISCNGEICWIASVTGIARPVLYHNGSLSAMILPEDSRPLTFNMLCEGDQLYVEGMFTSPEISLASAFWFRPGHCVSFDDGYLSASHCVSGGSVNCVFNPLDDTCPGLIYRNGEESTMPLGYAVMGNRCTAVAGGMLHIGLSSVDGDRPAIWRDGVTEVLDVCGYIASVSSE